MCVLRKLVGISSRNAKAEALVSATDASDTHDGELVGFFAGTAENDKFWLSRGDNWLLGLLCLSDAL